MWVSWREKLAIYLGGALLSWAVAQHLPRLHARLAARDRRARERPIWKQVLRAAAGSVFAAALVEWHRRA